MRAGTLALLLAAFAGPVAAQDIAVTFGDDAALATRSLQLIALITLLSLVPGLAVMVTCFPFIVTVLSILRQAIGLRILDLPLTRERIIDAMQLQGS